jgi:glycosyltransferase involved in cell wall biosynthesis
MSQPLIGNLSHRHVLAIGPFPPAVTGAAKNTVLVCNSVEARGVQVRRVATNKTRERSDHIRSLSGHAAKTLATVGNLGRILRSGDARNTTVYLVPDGGLGVAFSLAYARAASARYPKLVVHHRSYNHIVNPSKLMARLLRTAPERTLHVFLDPVMEERFKSVYSAQVNSVYVPNAATCDVEPAVHGTGPVPDDSRPVTVGFLSNLVQDKGFDVVAEAFGELNRRFGSRLRFALAGRPVDKRNAETLEELIGTLGDRLDYRGEVFGADKTDFFRACDIFLFPTRHSQEAQPNVLYEAMAAGSLIVSTRWAGVPWILEGTAHRLIDPGPDKGGEVVAAVTELLSGEDLRSARIRQSEAFRIKKSDADVRYRALIDYLAGAADPRTVRC